MSQQSPKEDGRNEQLAEKVERRDHYSAMIWVGWFFFAVVGGVSLVYFLDYLDTVERTRVAAQFSSGCGRPHPVSGVVRRCVSLEESLSYVRSNYLPVLLFQLAILCLPTWSITRGYWKRNRLREEIAKFIVP